MIFNHALRLFSAINITKDELGVPSGDLTQTSIANILRIVFAVAGAISVFIVTLAGFKYVLSQGNPQETAKAKNTIIYALIGLAVCIFAVSIVSFVINGIST